MDEIGRERLWFPMVDALFDMQRSVKLETTKDEFVALLRDFARFAFYSFSSTTNNNNNNNNNNKSDARAARW